MIKKLEALPENQVCLKRITHCQYINICDDVATLIHSSKNQAIYYCASCKSQYEYRLNKETEMWELQQNENRVYTNNERVLDSKYDCMLGQRKAA